MRIRCTKWGEVVAVIVLVIVVASIAGTYWLYRPSRFRETLKIGMTRSMVIRLVGPYMLDEMDTRKRDLVIERREAFGVKRWNITRIRYDGVNSAVVSIDQALIDPDRELWVFQ